MLNTWIERRSQNIFDGAKSCRLNLRGPICKVHRHVRDFKARLYIENKGAYTEFVKLGGFGRQEGKAVIVHWDKSRRSVTDGLRKDTEVIASIYFLLAITSEHSEEE